MEMKQISGLSTSAGFKPGRKIQVDNKVDGIPRDAFTPGEQVGPDSDKMRQVAGNVKKSWNAANEIKDVAANVLGGFCGVIGGALGCALGLAYDATVIGPFIGGGMYADEHYGMGYFEGMVTQFASPVTLAIKGAKNGFRAGRNAVLR